MNLSLKNISKSFGEKEILKDFNYEFKERGIYAICGESGAGKTTLLRIIAGLDKNYNGSVAGNGFENVSVAFQEYRLFPNLTAIENVVIPNADKNDKTAQNIAKEILLQLGFSNEDLNKRPRELSGGMKQRVSFARAIMKKSPILLLDEPTKELDSALRDTVYDIITEEANKRLVIIVTHNSEDIEKLSATKIFLR